MAECIHCGAPYIVKGSSGRNTKLTRYRHLDFASKAIESARNQGRKPSKELEAHVERIANNRPW